MTRATIKPTNEIIDHLVQAGLMKDARNAALSYDYGGLKYIARAALGLAPANSNWLTFGVLDDLAAAVMEEQS